MSAQYDNRLPIISVIIPAYNVEKYITETIQSILNQTFQEYEIVIVDDASTDKTLEIAKSFQDPRIQILSNTTNVGLAASRNRGIKLAKGEFVSFLDADDLWTPDKLELQLKALEDHPEAAVTYSWVDFIDEEGKWLYKGCRTTPSGYVYEKLLVRNFLDCGSNALIRKNAFSEVGLFDEELKQAEDRDMWVRLAKRSNFITVCKPQILYRQRKSLSSNVLVQMQYSKMCISKAFSNAPRELQYLKKESLGITYSYLSMKAAKDNEILLSLRLLAKSILIYWKIIFNEMFEYALFDLIRAFIRKSLPKR